MSAKRPSNWQNRGNYSSPEYIRNRAVVRNRDGGFCIRCRFFGLYTIATDCDHHVPQSQGGTHDVTNLAMLCASCHQEKTQRESKGLSGWLPRTDPATGWDVPEPDWIALIAERTKRYFNGDLGDD